jgi:uncharacterized membrane protein YoaK (UPF0700 family)
LVAAPVARNGYVSDGLRTTTDERRCWEDAVQEELHHARSLGLSVALGAAMGAALGAAVGHAGIWVAAGIAAYIAISLVGGAWSNKVDDRERTTHN